MSSNAFLRPVPLTSLPRPIRMGIHLSWRRTKLVFNSAGDCFFGQQNDYKPVELLRERSLWLSCLAGLTVRDANQRVFVLWFLRWEQYADGWRRARVRFLYP